MPDTPVDIIIVTHGNRRYLRLTLPALLQTRHPHRITIVANRVLTSTIDWLSSKPIGLLINTENVGYPRAANQAWRLASGDVCVVGDDCLCLDPDWLYKLVDIAECCPEVGIVGHSVEAGWPARRVGSGECTRTVQVQPSGLGGVYLIPKRTYDVCGLFNEEMGPYAEEDALYGWKVRFMGKLCAYFDHIDLGRSFEHIGHAETQSEQYLKWKATQRKIAIPIRDRLIEEYKAGRPLNT